MAWIQAFLKQQVWISENPFRSGAVHLRDHNGKGAPEHLVTTLDL